jgi:two-component system, chemotaxis family, chemotaxis protein CheY
MKNILIVDDSDTSRMIIKNCFIIAGYNKYNYHEARDALRAVDIINKEKIDLIITDLIMPKMDGKTFIKKIKIKSLTNNIPVIVISSMADNIIEKELIDIGATAIIKKPLSPEKVYEVMKGIKWT